MKHGTGVALIRRIHANLDAGRRELADAALHVATEPYFSQAAHARDVALLRRHPVIVGHSAELPVAGAMLTHDATGVPILVVRGADGRVRAFLNACRHRGARLVSERRGRVSQGVTCPYHAWRYGLDGRLAATGDEAAYPELGPRGLVALPAAERFGLLWVRPEPAAGMPPPLDIDEFLGPLADDFAAWGLESHVHHAPEVLPAAMNWKLMVDTFLEDTHFRFVHGRSVHRFYLDDASLYDRFGPHMRYVIPKRTIRDLKGVDAAQWRLRDHANILYLLFPNTVMVFVADHAAIFAMFPVAPDRSQMELTFCLPEAPRDAKAEAYWAKNTQLIRTALAEDFRVGEGVQAGLASGANADFVFGRYEKGLQFFHRALADAGA